MLPSGNCCLEGEIRDIESYNTLSGVTLSSAHFDKTIDLEGYKEYRIQLNSEEGVTKHYRMATASSANGEALHFEELDGDKLSIDNLASLVNISLAKNDGCCPLEGPPGQKGKPGKPGKPGAAGPTGPAFCPSGDVTKCLCPSGTTGCIFVPKSATGAEGPTGPTGPPGIIFLQGERG